MNNSLLMEVCERYNFSRFIKTICFQSMQTSNWLNKYGGNAWSVYGPQTNGMAPIHTENRLSFNQKCRSSWVLGWIL